MPERPSLTCAPPKRLCPLVRIPGVRYPAFLQRRELSLRRPYTNRGGGRRKRVFAAAKLTSPRAGARPTLKGCGPATAFWKGPMRALIGLFFWPGVVLLGILIGASSALIMLRQAPNVTGPWVPSPEAGAAAKTDSYTRARVSLCCLLAPTRKEVILFRADRDSTGQPLRANCTYQVIGRPPAARWWSLTVYGSDHFLIETKHGRYSVNAASAKPGDNGQFTVEISPKQTGGAWLPTRGAGPITLLLRAYGPSAKLIANPSGAALPSIRPVGRCV